MASNGMCEVESDERSTPLLRLLAQAVTSANLRVLLRESKSKGRSSDSAYKLER
jgi:hypothetical protein